jgi:ketosteroid isomerase-like protein
MTNDITRGIIGKLHSAFAQGDHEQLARCYDDDIDWTFHAPVSVFPFLGRRIGKAAVFASLRELYAGYKIEALAMQLVLADGDRAAVISEVALQQRATGRTIRCRVASFHRVRGGRVVEYEGFLDSFDAVEQAFGRYIEV